MRSVHKETLKKKKHIVGADRVFEQILLMLDTSLVTRERRLPLVCLTAAVSVTMAGRSGGHFRQMDGLGRD